MIEIKKGIQRYDGSKKDVVVLGVTLLTDMRIAEINHYQTNKFKPQAISLLCQAKLYSEDEGFEYYLVECRDLGHFVVEVNADGRTEVLGDVEHENDGWIINALLDNLCEEWEDQIKDMAI